MAKITLKQQTFADYYIETGNAEQSAIKAGYSKAYARGNAHKLVANGCIKKYIDDRMKEIESERVADQTEIIEYLTSVMRGETKEETLISKDVGYQEKTKIEVSAKDRIKAAELLGKRYAMWTDKQQVEGNVGVTIVDDVDDDDE